MSLIKIDQNKLNAQKNAEAESNRKSSYIAEADPIFFKVQRGEATQEEWLEKIAEIKQRFPKV
jgi:hypothetical protein